MLCCRGLVYLHSQHIVWFDCKPGNVLLDETGSVAKISDVGLSKMLATTQTETVLVGCIFYLTILSVSVRQVWAIIVIERQVSKCISCSCGDCLTHPTKTILLPLHALR